MSGIPVLLGTKTGTALEYLAKILHIHNAAMLRHGLDLQPGGFQQVLGKIHPLGVNIICQGLSGFLFE